MMVARGCTPAAACRRRFARPASTTTKVIAGHGSPWPFLRKGSREELRLTTGATKLPAPKLADGTVITHSRAILSWIKEQN
jgi:hypothetical protein